MAVSDRSLKNVDLLKDLPQAELDHLAQIAEWRRVNEKEPVVSHLDEGTEVFFVVEGSLRAVMYSLAGREVAFRDFHAGQFFGELAAIDGRARSASVVALGGSLVAALPAKEFKSLLRRQPLVAERIEVELTTQIRQLTERVFEYSALAVRHRLHAELLRLAGLGAHEGDEIIIAPAPTHAELASRISTHREAVTRELNALAHAGVIEQRRAVWAITDLAELQRMVHEVTGLPADQVVL